MSSNITYSFSKSKKLKYASFFTDLEITKEGIMPLPKKRKINPKWNPKSDIPEMFYNSESNISPHEFEYVLNPFEYCTDVDEVYLLVMIASASWQFERRKVIRETWASQKIENKTLKYLFFIGNDHKAEKELNQEFKQYGDIVEENFQENYYNLTLKTIGQLKWATYYCPNMKYGLHIDDDVFGQVTDIVQFLAHQEMQKDLIGCSKVFHPVVRRDGKWNMPIESYPGNQYPLGCVGWCFVMSANVIRDLYWMSLDTPLIFLEDVTTTGILREKIGVDKVIKMPGNEQFCQHKGWPKDRPVEEKLIESWNLYKTNL